MKPESKSSITSDIVSLLTFSGSPPLQLLYQVKVLFLGMIRLESQLTSFITIYCKAQAGETPHSMEFFSNTFLQIF